MNIKFGVSDFVAAEETGSASTRPRWIVRAGFAYQLRIFWGYENE